MFVTFGHVVVLFVSIHYNDDIDSNGSFSLIVWLVCLLILLYIRKIPISG